MSENSLDRGNRRIRIRLYGSLGKKFGREFYLFINSVAEAVKLLEANFPGEFMKNIRDGHFYIINGDSVKKGLNLTTEGHLCAGLLAPTLHIVPVAAGAGGGKSGMWMAIAGVVILGAAIAFSGGLAATSLAGVGEAFGTYAIGSAGLGLTWGTIGTIGLALAVGGLMQMLAPVAPSTDNTTQQNFFSGPVNLTTQGSCIPLVYGRVRCGSTVMSAAIHVVPKDTRFGDGISYDSGNIQTSPSFAKSFAATHQSGYV
jgi:predicted phage tail protein